MDEEPSTYDKVVELLTKFNKVLSKNLKKYKIQDAYGLFITLTFVLSLSFGYLSASYLVDEYNLSFALMFLLFTFIFSVVSLAIISYVIVHLYAQSYPNTNIIKTVLSYQIINMLISIIMSFILVSDLPIYGGYFIFLILSFIHPISGYLYSGKLIIQDIEKKLKVIYTLITIIFTIIQIILKISNLI